MTLSRVAQERLYTAVTVMIPLMTVGDDFVDVVMVLIPIQEILSNTTFTESGSMVPHIDLQMKALSQTSLALKEMFQEL